MSDVAQRAAKVSLVGVHALSEKYWQAAIIWNDTSCSDPAHDELERAMNAIIDEVENVAKVVWQEDVLDFSDVAKRALIARAFNCDSAGNVSALHPSQAHYVGDASPGHLLKSVLELVSKPAGIGDSKRQAE